MEFISKHHFEARKFLNIRFVFLKLMMNNARNIAQQLHPQRFK